MAGLGGLIAGAGVVGDSWRRTEDALRQQRQRRYQTEEMDRADAFYREMADAPLPQQPQFTYAPGAAGLAPQTQEVRPPGGQAGLVTRPLPEPQAAARRTAAPAPGTPVVAPKAAAEPQAAGLKYPQRDVPQHVADLDTMRSAGAGWLDAVTAAPRAIAGGVTGVATTGMNYASRALNAILGEDRFRTDREGTGFSLAPFSAAEAAAREERNKDYPVVPEAVATDKGTTTKGLPKVAPGTKLDMSHVITAMFSVESNFNPAATSKKGAVGIPQGMIGSAMDPGYGVPDIFSLARNMGVSVGEPTKAEAERLLRDTRVGPAWGAAYFGGMMDTFGGDFAVAAMAYNGGPTLMREWLRDPGKVKLPTETRNYVPLVIDRLQKMGFTDVTADAVTAALGGGTATAARAPAGLKQTAATPEPTRENPLVIDRKLESDATAPRFIEGDPGSVTEPMRQLQERRAELVRMAEIAGRSRDGNRRAIAIAAIRELDNRALVVQGMAGVQDLMLRGDPRRMSAVWSKFAGADVRVEPTSPTTANIYVNGQLAHKDMDINQIRDTARLAFDEGYREQQAKAAAEYEKKLFEARIAESKTRVEKQLDTVKELAKQQLDNTGKYNVEQLKQAAGKNVEVKELQDGTVILTQGGNVTRLSPSAEKIPNTDMEVPAWSTSRIQMPSYTQYGQRLGAVGQGR